MIQLDLPHVVANVRAIREQCGVEVWAVVKANAYGLGISRISAAIAAEVDGFCVFSLDEAIDARLSQRTGKPVLAMGPCQPDRLADYLHHRVTPAVARPADAAALRAAHPVLCVDVGMGRFGATSEEIDAVIEAGGCAEAFVHAVTLDEVERFVRLVGERGMKVHAAATALLDHPPARLDAVRPGLALYDGAVRIVAPLIEVHERDHPIGYSRFSARRHGVILAGYANGLRPGPCLVNGQPTRLREVGMQSAYVDLSQIPARVGDEVVLLGDALPAPAVAKAWGTTPQEVLIRLGESGSCQG